MTKRKATLSVQATISIDADQFPKTKDWDIEYLKHIVPELIGHELRFKSRQGLKMVISFGEPTALEILRAIRGNN